MNRRADSRVTPRVRCVFQPVVYSTRLAVMRLLVAWVVRCALALSGPCLLQTSRISGREGDG